MSSKFNFESPREQSLIKSQIVSKYFSAWSKVFYKQDRLGYIDLFSGPGIYENGIESTPMLITRHCIEDEKLRDKICLIFNEKDKDLYKQLKSNLSTLNLEKLKFTPKIHNICVDYNTPKIFKSPFIPCFSFIDPAGYAGLSLELLSNLGKDFGSDLLFFFNFNDINRAINNPKVKDHMIHLFGESHFNSLSSKLNKLNTDNPTNKNSIRENIVINEISEALQDCGLQYILPFRFKFEKKDRTSHYLIFASKHVLGFNIMKEIMYNTGEKDINGIGKFEFIPACDKENYQLSIINMFDTSIEDFKNHLLNTYSGKTILLKDLYYLDTVNNKFIMKQYQEALTDLEEKDKIQCNPPFTKRMIRKGIRTMNPKKVTIAFP